MPRQIPPDDGCLMEVAHLHGIAGSEGCFDAGPSITDDGLDRPTRLFKVIDPAQIIVDRLPTDREPIDVPVEVSGPEKHDAHANPKKEPIDNEDDRAWGKIGSLRRVRSELLSNPGNTFPGILTELS